MLIPARGPDDDIAARFNSSADILNDSIGRRKFNANIHIGQRFRRHGTVPLEDSSYAFSLLARGRIDLASHFAESD